MSEGAFGKEDSTATNQVNVPEFLQPLINSLTGGSRDLIGNLLPLAGQDLTAGATPALAEGEEAAIDIARGGGDFIPTAQDVFGETARGVPISQFTEGFDDLSSIAGGDVSALSPDVLEALSSTVRGDFLFGGEGFDQGVDAAVQAALPNIRSAFGSTRGGLSGSSARQAVGDTAVNAFARQFGDERRNQLTAADMLTGARGGDIGRRLSGANVLSGLSSRERDRQLGAAEGLPELGLAGSNILRGVGETQRGREEDALRSPFENQMQLLQMLLGGFPIQSLLGQTQDQEGEFFNLGFS